MSSRAKYPRKATEGSVYVDSLQLDESGASSDEGEERAITMKKGLRKRRKGTYCLLNIATRDTDLAESAGRATDDSDSEDGTWARRKRAKAQGRTAGKGKGKETKEDLLATIPLDLLVEIFSYLLPLELLVFSRTNTSYRDLLTSKRSRGIWRTSRRLVKMPDLEAEDFSEMAYAELAFGTRCEICTKVSCGRPDSFLRIRLCRDCRKDHFVRLSTLSKTHPHHHPLLSRVVPNTPYSPPDPKLASSIYYALRRDLDYYDRILQELQDQDDADTDRRKLECTASQPVSASKRSLRARRSTAAAVEMGGASRVQRYIKERAAILTIIRKDGVKMHDAYPSARSAATSLTDGQWYLSHKLKSAKAEIRGYPSVIRQERKKFDLDLWPKRAFIGFWGDFWAQDEAVNRPIPLTDEEWPAVKTACLSEVRKQEEQHAKRHQNISRESKWYDLVRKRIENLREYYNTLFDDEPDEWTRLRFPLFRDFLQLDSTRSLQLWVQPDDDVALEPSEISDGAWEAALPGIKADVAEYALKLILSSQSDDGNAPSEDKLRASSDQYADGFFSRAISVVCCSKGNCNQFDQWEWPMDAPEELTYVGTVSEVLIHQHRHHDVTPSMSYSRPKGEVPDFPLALPVEVTWAIEALVDLAGLAKEEAKPEDLDQLEERNWFKWTNSHLNKKRFETWRGVLDAVYREANRFSRMKPPRPFPPPCISLHRHRDYLSPQMDDEDV
ncbi:hypothetical protein JCM11641_006295 [Rhodosporidiobolus odoratus]